MYDASISNGPASNSGLQLRIETPENVVLKYQLAGPAARLIAYLIDLCIRLALSLASLIVVVPAMALFPGSALGFLLVSLFLIQWGYYVISEGFFKGKTLGKAAVGLRVIHEMGHPITFWPAVLRNLVRVADGFPYLFSGVGFCSMLLSRNFQRLGDLAAHTVVIAERHVVLPTEPVILERIQPLSRDDFGGGAPGTEVLTAIEHFLSRRFVLSHERGHEIAAVLAENLARHMRYHGDPKLVSLYPMAFLARIYVTFLRRDETNGENFEDLSRSLELAGAR